jgi:hypothetical protein
MNQLNRLYRSVVVTHARGTFLAGVAVLVVTALSSSALHTRAQVVAAPQSAEGAGGQPMPLQAEVLQLLSAYHGALAYGGDADAMASLWADDSSLTLNNGTPYIGKDAVVGFFVNGPYFHHNWVSLAPEWKTTITVQGDTAQATTECIATDVSVMPNVVRGVIQVNATCQRLGGKWVFTQMNNVSLPQL